MVGHVVLHAGEGIDAGEVGVADGGEFLFELLTGHRPRVLEVTQTFVGKEGQIAVGHYFLEFTLPPVGFGVLLTSQPAEKVRGAVVLQIRDKMVTMPFVFLTGFRVLKDRARTIMCKCHSAMA